MVGYNNSGNFNRDFKKMMEMTPKTYCRQICLKDTDAAKIEASDYR